VGSFAQQAVRRGLLDPNADFPDPPEEGVAPSLARRLLDWLRDAFDVRLERVPDDEVADEEDPDPDVWDYPDAPRVPDPEPYPDYPDDPEPIPELDTLFGGEIDGLARRAIEEARRRAEEAADDWLEESPVSREDLDELTRRAEELARELEALEQERAVERERDEDGGEKE
jgi:hypothetical protein